MSTAEDLLRSAGLTPWRCEPYNATITTARCACNRLQGLALKRLGEMDGLNRRLKCLTCEAHYVPGPGEEYVQTEKLGHTDAGGRWLVSVQAVTRDAEKAEPEAKVHASAGLKPCRLCGKPVAPWLRGNMQIGTICEPCLSADLSAKMTAANRRKHAKKRKLAEDVMAPSLSPMPCEAEMPCAPEQSAPQTPLPPDAPHVDVDLARVPEVWAWLKDLAEREDRTPEAQVRHILRGMHRTCAA